MQRFYSSLRRPLLSSPLHFFSPLKPSLPVAFPVNSSISKPPSAVLRHLGLGFRPLSPQFPGFGLVQSRGFATKERSRAPTTPITSKVKKYKIKAYSSFKSRFRTMKDGSIRRWRAGKRHNAHLKSKKSKRRLRRPELVHPAYAKVMKKLNFSG